MSLVKLNGFCYFLQIFRHIDHHAAHEDSLTGYCKRINARKQHLANKESRKGWVDVMDLVKEMEELNRDESLAIDPDSGGLFYALPDLGDFKGKHMMVRINMMTKIIGNQVLWITCRREDQTLKPQSIFL